MTLSEVYVLLTDLLLKLVRPSQRLTKSLFDMTGWTTWLCHPGERNVSSSALWHRWAMSLTFVSRIKVSFLVSAHRTGSLWQLVVTGGHETQFVFKIDHKSTIWNPLVLISLLYFDSVMNHWRPVQICLQAVLSQCKLFDR